MFENPVTQRIAAFLADVGIPVRAGSSGAGWLLPGLTIDRDGIAVDESALKYPGDLLHEAGHWAVHDPDQRATADVNAFGDAAEEMAAIAWSYAAALHIGIDLAIVFHPDGYRGGSAAILENFAVRRYFGVPLLQYYGLTTMAEYPAMARWMR